MLDSLYYDTNIKPKNPFKNKKTAKSKNIEQDLPFTK